MARRSRGREVALQMLFQREANPTLQRQVLENFVAERLREPELRQFCLALYDGVTANLPALDARMAEASENWRVARMPLVDRNILRLGAYELLHMPETPPAVAFDEAIELARRFGSADSSAFVNGVLDKVRKNAAQAPDAG